MGGDVVRGPTVHHPGVFPGSVQGNGEFIVRDFRNGGRGLYFDMCISRFSSFLLLLLLVSLPLMAVGFNMPFLVAVVARELRVITFWFFATCRLDRGSLSRIEG